MSWRLRNSEPDAPSTDSYVAPLIFGFSPGVQLHLVAGDLRRLSSHDTHCVDKIARKIASETGSTATLIGMACRLEHGEAVLVGIPVDEVERASGRLGLSVTVGGVVSGVKAAGPSMFAQLLAALDLAVARACAERYHNPVATAAALTRYLQNETDGRALRKLETAVLDISALFSMLLAGGSSRSAMTPRRKTVNTIGSTMNNIASEPVFVLCHVLMEQLQSSGRNQRGRYLAIGSSGGEFLSSIESVSAHHFIGDGVILCQQCDEDVCKPS